MKIVTDSAADLTSEDLAALPIAVAPLYIQFPEGELRSEDFTHTEFNNLLNTKSQK